MVEQEINLVEVLRRFSTDCELLTGLRHRKQLNRNFSGKFVAAYDGRIVASAETIPELGDKVVAKGFPFEFTAIEHFPIPRWHRRIRARLP